MAGNGDFHCSKRELFIYIGGIFAGAPRRARRRRENVVMSACRHENVCHI